MRDGGKLKYGLTIIPEEEFNRFHALVQSCFDQGRQRFSPTLETIGTDISWFPSCHRAYLAKHEALGVTMEDLGVRQEEFHIWITPAYQTPVFKFYMTLAHELVHGYAGLKYGHNAHWRRWFYRVMWHLHAGGFLPEPENELKMVLWGQGLSYNRVSGELELVTEAFDKARRDHSKVLDSYWKRIS